MAERRCGRALALGEFAAALTLERASSARTRGACTVARLAGWAHFQDPLDLSVARDGGNLRRAIDTARRMAGVAAADIDLVSLLDRGGRAGATRLPPSPERRVRNGAATDSSGRTRYSVSRLPAVR